MFTLRLVLVACCIGALSSADLLAQRAFAPGVVKTIQPLISGRDVHSLPMPLPGLNAEQYAPNYFPATETLYGATRQIVFHRDVWQHEFSFLPLRQLNVTATNLSGSIRDRNIFYMVYRVRNVGGYISHKKVVDQKYGHIDFEPQEFSDNVDPNVMSNRFFGRFTLSGWVQNLETGAYTEVTYQDQISPAIVKRVQEEEDPERRLFDTVQLGQTILERYPADSDQGGTWGVAIWYNVDPSLDFVSVKVGGLTNAYRMEVNPDKSITFKNKILQLNMYRPGDGVQQANDPIMYGIPLTDKALEQIDLAHRYHLPGPVIRGETVDPETLRSTLIFETDAELDALDFNSAIAAQLEKGTIPESVVTAFANSGHSLDIDAKITSTVPGQQWTINDEVNGVARTFIVKLQPEFWEKNIAGGIRFIKRLDHLWVYE